MTEISILNKTIQTEGSNITTICKFDT